MIGTVTVNENAVNRLFVLPEYQSCGYGSQLIDFAERKIAERFTHVYIDSSLAAKEMYLKRGYRHKRTSRIPAGKERQVPQCSRHHGKWENCFAGEMAMVEWGFIQWEICGGRKIEGLPFDGMNCEKGNL